MHARLHARRWRADAFQQRRCTRPPPPPLPTSCTLRRKMPLHPRSQPGRTGVLVEVPMLAPGQSM